MPIAQVVQIELNIEDECIPNSSMSNKNSYVFKRLIGKMCHYLIFWGKTPKYTNVDPGTFLSFPCSPNPVPSAKSKPNLSLKSDGNDRSIAQM